MQPADPARVGRRGRRPDRRGAFGRRGEAAAAVLLVLRGYRILGRRVRTPAGEVDLVCRRGSTLVVVEVKRRRRGGAAEAVGRRQEERLLRAAEWLAGGAPWARGLRVDLIAIDGWRLRHLPGAFGDDSVR